MHIPREQTEGPIYQSVGICSPERLHEKGNGALSCLAKSQIMGRVCVRRVLLCTGNPGGYQVDLSTALKFLGILVSGALGVLGTVTETRNERTNALTIWGRCALWLTIAGAVLALGAQVFDSISEKKRDHDILTGLQSQTANTQSALEQDGSILSRINDQSRATNDILTQNSDILSSTHRQSTVASVSLDSIQDLLTRFDEVNIAAEFELPNADPRVAALAAEFHQWANSAVPSATGCQGFRLNSSLATIICQSLQSNPGAIDTASSAGMLGELWKSLPLFTGRVWINRKPQHLQRMLLPNWVGSDLFMFNCSHDNQNYLIYYESNRRLYIRPTVFDSKSSVSECWLAKDTLVGIHHLAGSQIVVEFNWSKLPNSSELDPNLLKLHPDYLRIGAGDTTLYLYHFATKIQKPEYPYSANFALSNFTEATIPAEDDIKNRRSSLPPERQRDGAVTIR
jgi:hypothetical protein